MVGKQQYETNRSRMDKLIARTHLNYVLLFMYIIYTATPRLTYEDRFKVLTKHHTLGRRKNVEAMPEHRIEEVNTRKTNTRHDTPSTETKQPRLDHTIRTHYMIEYSIRNIRMTSRTTGVPQPHNLSERQHAFK